MCSYKLLEGSPMQLNTIMAILLQEFYHTRKSLEVFMDLFFYSIMTLIIFGYLSTFLINSANPIIAYSLLSGMILWEIVRVGQYSMSVGALWNVWSRNLSNMFITPLRIREYMLASMLSGTLKSLLIFLLISTAAIFIFNFNIFSVGILNLTLHFINLTCFSWSIGIFILGLIFRFGTRIQALAWGLIYIFQPLVAVFYPLNILPDSIQKIALAFPATYTFEAIRANLVNPRVDWQSFTVALFLNIFYLIFSLWFFNLMFNQSKKSG